VELAYIDVLRQLTAHHTWLRFPSFPVGGAASHTFLAILARALIECRFRSVLELGAGETSRVLSAWATETGARVWTIESDIGWVEECQRRASTANHEIVYAPLREDESGHIWYDFAKIRSHLGQDRAELIIVDGPIGTPSWSRAGIIGRFSEVRADDWVVLWDDLHREGDLQSFAGFVRHLREQRIPHDVACCQASRTLGLVFSPKYSRLKYYC
jgi:hypothetical protein